MGLWKFSSKVGKDRGLLALYVLHSLDREPKSGYDLLKEIDEKTGGLWVPSKGTLYPVLKQLEEENLIQVCHTGRRSKSIYDLTDTGRETLRSIKKHRRESREKVALVKNLLLDIFGEEKRTLRIVHFDLGTVIDALPPEKEEQAARILENCLAELQRID
jgi:DNA-binding PadR family transcriptional regulator